MDGGMIPEPQRTYLLELLDAVGPAAEDFVVAGAQTLRFAVQGARGTKDIDFLLNVLALRNDRVQLAKTLESLGYARRLSGSPGSVCQRDGTFDETECMGRWMPAGSVDARTDDEMEGTAYTE